MKFLILSFAPSRACAQRRNRIGALRADGDIAFFGAMKS